MATHVMPDTDVLVDFLRGYRDAEAWMEARSLPRRTARQCRSRRRVVGRWGMGPDGEPPGEAFGGANRDRVVVSSVVIAELYAGVRGDDGSAEQTALANLLATVPIVPVTAEIARLGGLYKREFGKSHGVGLADAIIAASAMVADAELQTLNTKHYPMFDGIRPPYQKGS